MRVKCFLFVVVLFVGLLGGCEEKRVTTAPSSEDVSVVTKNVSLENQLHPPKFSIVSFQSRYDTKQQTIVYKMKYQIDQDIYKRLTVGKQTMHFALLYPKQVSKIVQVEGSSPIVSPTASDGELAYSVVFKQAVAKPLTKKEKRTLLAHHPAYQLDIIDHERDVIASFNDLFGFNGYDPNTSHSSMLSQD
ncbi:hypothetical protein A374_14260 [Fictibacillus macauensis ZFHKF-1]|uniref:Lipoprotein n=1 Tax=Fictibacillus macauensis ZFHKF-1 TaxID=1196324 RepID=I8AGQ4_9BACL|nr:hypothetical protein [Fictibacillus macauensis]EIT84862.1 hypothetical protein A374_14260 [Fictibacillus macauensis ZFHKF-1]